MSRAELVGPNMQQVKQITFVALGRHLRRRLAKFGQMGAHLAPVLLQQLATRERLLARVVGGKTSSKHGERKLSSGLD